MEAGSMNPGGFNPKKSSGFKDECGVVGVWNAENASHLAFLSLYAIQHRGQESAGIVSLENQKHFSFKAMGLVGDVFNQTTLDQLPGRAAVGHVRYSTTGVNQLANTQPLTASLATGPLAVAHNGNIVNASELKTQLKSEGSIFQGTNDTEVLLHLLARSPSSDLIECLKSSLPKLIGAYSLTLLSHECLVAIRDPWGFRPLSIGTLEQNDGSLAYIIASETCAFDLIGAKFLRDVEPGEIWWVDKSGTHSLRFESKVGSVLPRQCVFEHVYFARPDSVVFGESVYQVRKRLGALLSQKDSADSFDVVIPVPDSGVPAALGYSEASGLKFELGIIRNHYVGRTFIQPLQSIRDFGVKIKLNPQTALLRDQKVVVIDDSLVRGTTSKKIISLVRAAGAREVHLRIAAPPTVSPCYYGVDTPEKDQLIAARRSVDEIRQFVGADSVKYLDIEDLKRAVSNSGERSNNKTEYCMACFGGEYPTELFGLNERPKGNIRGIE